MTKLFDNNSEDFLNAIKGVVESTAAFEKARDEEKKKRMSGEDRDKVAKLAAMMSKEKKMRKEEIDKGLEDELKATRQTKKSVADAKKKYAKEDVDQIDELSTQKLTDYTAKASDARGHKNMSAAKLDKRYKGMATAHEKIRARHVKVPANEEAEQIDELSKKTLGSYVNKATRSATSNIAGAVASGMSGTPSEDGKKMARKSGQRMKGIAKAVDRLTKEEIEMIEAKLAGVEAGAVPGDEHLCATKIFHKEWNEGTPIKTMHAEPDANGLIEWYDVMFEHGIERVMTADVEILEACTHGNHKRRVNEEVEELDELSHDTLRSYRMKAKSIADHGGDQRTKGRELASRKSYGGRMAGIEKAKVMAKEEADLEEKNLTGLPKSTAEKNKQHIEVTHVSGNKKRVPVHPSMAYKALNRYRNDPTTKSARIVSEEIDELDESVAKAAAHLIKRYGDNVRKSHVRSAANDLGVGYVALSHHVRKKLGVNRLEEARGRPKKAAAKDFTVHPKTGEKLMHNNPEHMKRIEKLQKHGVLEKPKTEAGQHIINQLRKASTSMQGGATVHFTHGESKHVSAAHAGKALDKYASMKPSEKEDYQKKISHSHEQLMKHI